MARVSSFRDRGGLFTSLIYLYMYKSYQLIATIITKAIWNCQQKSNNDIHKNTWTRMKNHTHAYILWSQWPISELWANKLWTLLNDLGSGLELLTSRFFVLLYSCFPLRDIGCLRKIKKINFEYFFFFVVITECLLFILRDIRFKFRLELFGHLCMLY